MDISDSTKKNRLGKFWHGLLLALAGWAVDVGIATLIYSLGTFDLNRGWEHFSIFTGMSGVFGILLAVIWLPVAIIAGSRSRKKGFKAVFTVVLITSIIAPILIGCGFGLLAAYFG